MQTLFSPLFQYLIVNVKFSLILDSIIKSIDCSFTVIWNLIVRTYFSSLSLSLSLSRVPVHSMTGRLQHDNFYIHSG